MNEKSRGGRGAGEQGGFCPQFHSVCTFRSKGAFAHNSTRFVPFRARGLLPTIPLGLYLSQQGGFCPQFHSVCTFPPASYQARYADHFTYQKGNWGLIKLIYFDKPLRDIGVAKQRDKLIKAGKQELSNPVAFNRRMSK